MGVVFSVLASIQKCLLTNNSGLPISEQPICYLRTDDYSISGTLRPTQEKWNKSLNSMIFLDIGTRKLLWPIIQKRMDKMDASMKYSNLNLEDIKTRFPRWDDKKIFEIHDLFQAFEVDGDGLIEVIEMSVGLDNLGDTTSPEERLDLLTSTMDDDGNGSVDFEEFLQIMYEVHYQHPDSALTQTFMRVNHDIKFIRWMSTIQQIRSGFF